MACSAIAGLWTPRELVTRTELWTSAGDRIGPTPTAELCTQRRRLDSANSSPLSFVAKKTSASANARRRSSGVRASTMSSPGSRRARRATCAGGIVQTGKS